MRSPRGLAYTSNLPYDNIDGGRFADIWRSVALVPARRRHNGQLRLAKHRVEETGIR
jgi:hypothetical protein